MTNAGVNFYNPKLVIPKEHPVDERDHAANLHAIERAINSNDFVGMYADTGRSGIALGINTVPTATVHTVLLPPATTTYFDPDGMMSTAGDVFTFQRNGVFAVGLTGIFVGGAVAGRGFLQLLVDGVELRRYAPENTSGDFLANGIGLESWFFRPGQTLGFTVFHSGGADRDYQCTLHVTKLMDRPDRP